MAESGGTEARALPRALAALGRAAARARRERIRLMARLHDRRRLPGLVALPPDWRSLEEPARTLAIIGRLKCALRLSLALRARRDWVWCPRRHEALLAALAGEMLRLRKLS